MSDVTVGRRPALPRLGGIASLAVVLALLILLGRSLLQTPSPMVQVSGPARDFSLTLFDGREIRLSSLRGQVVVLNFWASWCIPCRDEAPLLERFSREYRDRGVVVLGVDTWDNDDAARAFIREFRLTYPNGPDPTGEITINYGVAGVPETFIIDREGNLVRRYNGQLTQTVLARLVSEASR